MQVYKFLSYKHLDHLFSLFMRYFNFLFLSGTLFEMFDSLTYKDFSRSMDQWSVMFFLVVSKGTVLKFKSKICRTHHFFVIDFHYYDLFAIKAFSHNIPLHS